jgi:hypothetical protein
MAVEHDFDYYIYHCWGDVEADYLAIERLLQPGKPVIIAHPYAIGTDLNRIPTDCLVEINNRYIWRTDWTNGQLTPFINTFRWVISSDAHQPHWLNQNYARQVAEQLGICETLLFAD